MKDPRTLLNSINADKVADTSVVVSSNDLATKARKIARKERVQTLPVVQNGNLKGVLRIQDLLKITSTRSNVKVSGLMTSPSFTATPDWSLREIAKKAIEFDVSMAPVIRSQDDKELVGIVKLEDILEEIAEYCGDKPKIGEIMTREVLTVQPQHRISKAWNRMEESNISGIPVVEDSRVVGIMTRLDLIRSGKARFAVESTGKKSIPRVKTVMKGPPTTVRPDDSIGKASKMMQEKNIGRLPVIKNESLIGIVDREDIIGTYL